jgi:hypothetical protein
LHLKARESDAAWQDFEDFRNSGGGNLPPATWFGLIRVREQKQDYEWAQGEYEKLIAAYPAERQALWRS